MVCDVMCGQSALLPHQGEMRQKDTGEQQAAASLQVPVRPRPADPGHREEEERDERG